MIKCNKCLIEKSETEFNKLSASPTGYRYTCRICEKLYRQKLQREKYEEVYFYLLEHGCEECGESNPLKLEFDHIDPTTKKYSISDICSRQYSMETVFNEITKCRVLCSNCHKVKTHKERNTIPYQIHQECK